MQFTGRMASLCGVAMSADSWDPLNPWLRQPCDSDDDYQWFQHFLVSRPRRIATLVKIPGCPWTKGQLEDLAWENLWKDRAEAWDTHLATVQREAVEEVLELDAKALAREQALAARDLRRLGHGEVKALLEVQGRTPHHPGTLRPSAAIRALDVSIRLERQISGATQTIEGDDSGLEALSLEELRTLQALQAKVEAARRVA